MMTRSEPGRANMLSARINDSVLVAMCSLFLLCLGCKSKDPCATLKGKSIDSNDSNLLSQEVEHCLTRDEVQLWSRSTILRLVTSGQGKSVGEILDEQRDVETRAGNLQMPELAPTPRTAQPLASGSPTSTSTATSINDPFSTTAEVLQRAVVFIYLAGPDGKVNGEAPSATGFIVSIPSKKNPARHMLILVTSRHVFDPEWAKCSGNNPKQIFIRMNRRNPGSSINAGVGYEPITLVEDGRNRYVVPHDESIDVSGILLKKDSIRFDNYDVQFVNMSLLATDEEVKSLKVDSAIITAGLLPTIEAGSQEHNDPAVERGFITDKTSNKVVNAHCDSDLTKKISVWLIRPALDQGFSGAPIFAPMVRSFRGTPTRGPVLIGLQSMRLGKNDPGGMTLVNSLVQVMTEIAKPWPDANLSRGFPDQASNGEATK